MQATISVAEPGMFGGDGLTEAYVSTMTRVNLMRWSGRSQDLLVRAVADPALIAAMQANGIPESQLRLWVAQTDVPITFWLRTWP